MVVLGWRKWWCWGRKWGRNVGVGEEEMVVVKLFKLK